MPLMAPRFRRNGRLRTAALNYPPLKHGDSGIGVRDLQRAFLDLGYEMPLSIRRGQPDGIFGQETESVVKRFQLDQALEADGVAGRLTLSRLDDIFCRNDSFYSDVGLAEARLAGELLGPDGARPFAMTTRRKSVSGD
jgi:hypothetical protein